MMIINICMVNGTSDQKLLPPAIASFDGLSRSNRPVRNTTTMPINANTNGSGNQRSLQLASARPKRTSNPSCWLACFESTWFCGEIIGSSVPHNDGPSREKCNDLAMVDRGGGSIEA